MTQYISWLAFFIVSISSYSAYSQQAYLSTINDLKATAPTNSQTSQSIFVGCIDYSVQYIAVPTVDSEQKDKAEFAVALTRKANGDKRTVCFNRSGDWLHIYKNGEQVDRIWYFSERNEEYTFFKNGVLKFSTNDIAEPEGFSELGIEDIVRTKECCG